ncbi:MAG: M20 family peptidase, partial [candidate division Zixibacteria bacterium]|nr:M20 family metallopeptidase [candidate division Zixibacteria bacterium]NIX57779.1 M20 family peptidase [candidate division Zixibacteria bacterium]
MNTLPKILRHIDPNRIKNLLVEAVDQYSPSFAEIPAMRVFAEALDEAGIPYYRQSVPSPLSNSNRGNLVVGLGPTDDIALLWVGHLDTIELWHDEGHQARIAGDALYGLGAADMKGG